MINKSIDKEGKMFCYQCQETAGGTGCTFRGVCGKTDEIAGLQDILLAETEKLAFAATWLKDEGRQIGSRIDRMITKNLFITITNVNFEAESIKKQISETEFETMRLMALSRSRRNMALAFDRCENAGYMSEDAVSLHSLVLFGLKGMAAYVHHAGVLGKRSVDIDEFIRATLSDLYECRLPADELMELVITTGQYGLEAMEMLDAANTECYGEPEMTRVRYDVTEGPGILVSGHDLGDLEQLLKQSEGSGVSIYTHGEMLPALSYPHFKKYKHLIGNYGGAWHEQAKDFREFGGPVVMTSNCLIPPKDDYSDRIYVTGPVAYPGCRTIPENEGVKDFRAVIEHAKASLPPLERHTVEGITGFGHGQLEKLADNILKAVKYGDLSELIVMAGCDGRMKSRQYYTEYAKELPEDTIILTAGCAKYRYNRLGLGNLVAGEHGEIIIPRVIDAGQCNDSYSLIKTAQLLKETMGIEDINELPIVYNIAWYEQKAVIVLLALLALGIKDIRLGPGLPAFMSRGVRRVLEEKYGLRAPLI